MTEFAPAVRTNTAIVLALAGASGSGKTKSALELAVGLAGERGQILMIGSEGKRGLMYADKYRFHHYQWEPPYTPESLGELLREAERQNFAVVIVDSMSDEHEGEGGLCDMAEAERQAQIAKGWAPNDHAKWARPKASHKYHVLRWLRNTKCHVILCLRAQEKSGYEETTEKGKTVKKLVSLGWTPVCEKNLPYEVQTSLSFVPWTNIKEPDPRGKPIPIRLHEDHAQFFPLDAPISRDAGKRLAEWAAGARASSSPVTEGGAAPLGEDDALRDDLNATAESKAALGSVEFKAWWKELLKRERDLIRGMVRRYEVMAREADDAPRCDHGKLKTEYCLTCQQGF